MAREIRFAAGSEGGLRSTVWKLFASRDDSVYLQSRMMGSDTKISFHKSGLCQWSNTEGWVRKNLGRGIKNADRHRYRWNRTIPVGMEAVLTFRVIIPESEMRQIPEEKRLEKVRWLPDPQKGQILAIDLYFIPPVDGELDESKFPFSPLVIWAMADKSRFVALYHVEDITPLNFETLSRVRAWIQKDAREQNISLQPQFRAAGLFTNDAGWRGLFEIVPYQS